MARNSIDILKKCTISTFATFAIFVLLGYCFERTKPWASKICSVQYAVGDESVAMLYGYGPADGITLLFYVAWALILTSFFEDVIQNLKLSPNIDDFSQQMTQTLFFVSSFLFGLCVLIKGNYDSATFWNGFPDYNLPYLLKVFYLAQVAFLVQCFPQAMLQGLSPWESLSLLIEAEVLLVFLGASYAVNYTPIATVLLMVHYAAKLLLQLATNSCDSKSLRTYVKFALFGAEQILDLGAATGIYLYADSRGLPLRYIALAAAVVSAALGGLGIYNDTAKSGSASNLPFLPTASTTRKVRKGSRSRRGSSSRGRKGKGDRR